MDGPVELLVDDAWAAEDDKTGFLGVGVDSFDWYFFKRWTIYFPMIQISTKKW